MNKTDAPRFASFEQDRSELTLCFDGVIIKRCLQQIMDAPTVAARKNHLEGVVRERDVRILILEGHILDMGLDLIAKAEK